MGVAARKLSSLPDTRAGCNRFAAKRREEEWFDLDASDVNTFKGRKFMQSG
jgi:hypothetical protein